MILGRRSPEMKATAWKGGSYGIRVGRSNAKKYFPRHWQDIEVTMGGNTYSFPLSATFWTTCPELRGAVIEAWLKSHSLIPWPKGSPPRVTLTPLGGRRFNLSYT
jgi:hypothetical protein